MEGEASNPPASGGREALGPARLAILRRSYSGYSANNTRKNNKINHLYQIKRSIAATRIVASSPTSAAPIIR